MKYSDAVSVGAISLNKVSLLPGADVKENLLPLWSIALKFQEGRLGESDTDY